MPRNPAAPKVRPLLTRPEVVGLCKRFLKNGAYDAKSSPIILYTLMKAYPSRGFWMNRELGFQLNSMLWFLGKDGKEWLKSQWDIYHLVLPEQKVVELQPTKVGEDVVIKTRPRTIGELLR